MTLLTTKIIHGLLAALIFTARSSSASLVNLRSSAAATTDVEDPTATHHHHHTGRKLQLANALLNSLVNIFTPNLNEFLTEELAAYDPIDFGTETTVNLGESDFNGTCPSSANLTYGVGGITGLSNMNVNRIELLSGSEEIVVSFLGVDGADWSGDWYFNVTFPNVTAVTTVGLTANLCGFPIDQTFSGATTISNANVAFTVSMDGETNNVFNFQDTSQVTKAEMMEMNLELGSVEAKFGLDGNIVNLNVAEDLEKWLLNDFSNDIEPLVVNIANVVLESEAPFSLADDGTMVSKRGSN